jgi:hypothetical protein
VAESRRKGEKKMNPIDFKEVAKIVTIPEGAYLVAYSFIGLDGIRRTFDIVATAPGVAAWGFTKVA